MRIKTFFLDLYETGTEVDIFKNFDKQVNAFCKEHKVKEIYTQLNDGTRYIVVVIYEEK